MKKKYLFVCVMLLVILFGSMGLTTLYVSNTEDAQEEADVTIVTSFYPIYIACLNITDGVYGVRLENLSEPQTGCLHDFQLTPEDLKLLSTADVFVINGGGIESFMEEVAASDPQLAIITACEGLELLEEDEDEQDSDLSGDEEASHEHETNAHAWMSVAYYREMIAGIAEGLAAEDPAHSEEYYSNAQEYDAKLAILQEEQEELIQEVSVPVIIFHSAYAYVAWDYHLDVVGLLDLDEERQVSAGEVADVLDIIEEQQVTYILAEELYGSSMGETIQKEADVTVLYLNPLTRGDYDKDSYLDAMRENIAILKGAGL